MQKNHFPDCNAFTEIGIIHCSCGRILKYKRSPTATQKANNDYTSIPGFVIKKNSSRGPKHGQSERQIMFFKAKQMLKKARQKKHGNNPTMLSRRYEQEDYRKSLTGEHALIVAHHTAWLKNVLVRVISSAWSSTLCGCPFLDSLFLTLFLSVCFSCLLLLEP